MVLLLLCSCGKKLENAVKEQIDSDTLIKERLEEAQNRENAKESVDETNQSSDETRVEEKVDVKVEEDVKVTTKVTEETKTTTNKSSTNKNNSSTNSNSSNSSSNKSNTNKSNTNDSNSNTTTNNNNGNSSSNNSGNSNNSNTNNGSNSGSSSKTPEKEVEKQEETKVTKNNFVSYNGKLKVSGTNLVNQYGEKIQLKGVSSHGIQWFGNLVTNENLDILKNNWNSNVFRIAMYTVDGGYINNKSILNVVEQKMQMAINHDMYVIVDWHILNDGNPNTYINESKSFFEYMSKKYANVPNVIFEICNEPNGGVNWNNDIKPYADQVTGVIRKYSDAVVLVGTGTWSQDILDPVNNKLSYSNVMYDVHFYAGTHTDWLRNRVNEAYSKGLPIFISEWGTSDASGNGGVYLDESQKWIDFLNSKNISFINWSLTNKNESSALLKSGCTTLTDSCLTSSGTFVKKVIKG